MKSRSRAPVIALVVFATPVAIWGQRRPGLMGDLLANVSTVEGKVVGLANAIPEPAYAWRPSDGVRSVSEVLMHVAGENYFAAAKLGSPAPASTGIVGRTIKEAREFEERKLPRAEVIAALEQSFALLKKAMADTPDDKLDTTIAFFGPTRKDTRATGVGRDGHASA